MSKAAEQEHQDFDSVVKRIKNREKISFSWGFEYRYLQELGEELLTMVAQKNKLDRINLHVIRHPSIPDYADVGSQFAVTRTLRLSPELICVEGTPISKYVLHLSGTLANLLPGQDAFDALSAIKLGRIFTREEVDQRYHERLDLDATARRTISQAYGITPEQVAFNWGSGGSLELILWSVAKKVNRCPRMLINVPNYFYTLALGAMFGYNTKSLLSYGGKDYQFPFKSMLREIRTGRYDVVILTSPNNPFGVTISHEQFHELLTALPNSTVAILDFTGIAEHGMFHFRDVLTESRYQAKRILMLDSVSKKYEMCHVRAGVILGSNETIFHDLDLHKFSPILTKYAYEKLLYALASDAVKELILEKFRDYYMKLKSAETSTFRVVSPTFSNFLVCRFQSQYLLSKFIGILASRYQYYDLPFAGAGKFSKGGGNIAQNTILNLPMDHVRILAETADPITSTLRLL